MDIIAMLKEFFGMTRAVAEEANQHEALKNTPEMEAAKVAAQNQARNDQETKEIANEDTEAIRRRLADPDNR